MKIDSIELCSLVEVFEGSSLAEITNNSSFTTKGGKEGVCFYIASQPLSDCSMLLYQINIVHKPDGKDNSAIECYLNIHHMVKGKYGLDKLNSYFLNPNSNLSVLGAIYFKIHKKDWDIVRNGIITAIYDYVDHCIESHIAA